MYINVGSLQNSPNVGDPIILIYSAEDVEDIYVGES